MLFGSLAILLLSALLHALSNVPLKRARDKLAFAWWMLAAFCIPCAPVIAFVPAANPVAWLIVGASGLLEAIYFVALTRAFSIGELSLVYPVARGSAPLFLLCWAAMFLGEHPSRYGIIGITGVAAGLYLLRPPASGSDGNSVWFGHSSAMGWALLTGFVISVYSALDKIGIRYFSPLTYLWLVLSVCWIALSIQLLSKKRREAILREAGLGKSEEISGSPRTQRTVTRRFAYVFAAALLGVLAYLLVLFALRFTPVSYVTPMRAMSVVMSAWIGIRFMRESGGAQRIAASCLVAAGIIIITVAG